jgi:hypothetical protein
MSSAVLLPGLLPVNRPLYAVFAAEDGSPVFERVYTLGIYEVTRSDDDPGQRVIAAFSLGSSHIEQADFRPNFVAVTESTGRLVKNEVDPSVGHFVEEPDPALWVERCKAKRDALDEKARNQKIILPGGVVAVPGMHESAN